MNKILLHVNIYDIKSLDYINEFLFCLLFTKIFVNDENLFILPENIKIIIELPFGFGDFLKKAPILKFFEIKKIDLDKLPKLIINKKNKELKDKCNLIYSYLVYLDSGQINTYDFCIKGDQYVIGSRMLLELEDVSEDEYIPKIINVFDEKPTYYQIIAFINIFYLQLVKFSKNYMFKCQQLFDEKLLREGKNKNRIEFKIRGLMVKKLIELSKFCSIPAYKKLIESQKKNINEHDKEQNNINQKKNSQNNINQQNNENKIQENNDNIEDEEQEKDIIEEEEKNKKCN